MENSWSVPVWVTGVILTVLTFVVLIGGIKSIGRVTAGLVPMIPFYVLGGLYLLLVKSPTCRPRSA